MIAPQSGICLKAMTPIKVTRTIPNADHIAYATPIGIVFKHTLRQYNDTR